MHTVLATLKYPSVKFAVKAGLAAGAAYYIAEKGVWKESTETSKLCGQLCETASPYIKQAKAQIPLEIPELPSTDRISFLTKMYWNRGVSAIFTFLGNLPSNLNNWRKKGLETAMNNNPEFKKFVESFSAASPPSEPAKK